MGRPLYETAARWAAVCPVIRIFSGADEGTRTPDPIITNDVLYQLSYSGLVAGY